MNTLPLCEWSSVRASPSLWPPQRREAVQEAAAAWRDTHRLNALPLEWSGPDGCTLRSRQWVGVVEVEGGRVEIYPKTDKSLLSKSAPDAREAQSTLNALLRLLEASNYGEWVETDRAALAVADLTFVDLWAYLLGRHLWPQLRRGLPSAYLPHEDELTTVRGRIVVSRQIGRFQDRFDRIVCAWDEFSPDTALLRLLKCACRLLRRRVSHPLAMGLLGDCLFMLDDVADVPAGDALRATERMVWSRATERFRPTFQLARRVLAGEGPRLQSGHENTWVFLVDMNRVFEGFVRVALEDKFKIVVEEQQSLGCLFQNPARLKQLPDYLWKHNDREWIGDAKWKLLAGEIAENDGDETSGDKARLAPADVRQLTTYAELKWRQLYKKGENPMRAELAVFYPGVASGATTQVQETWNDTWLHMVPVNVAVWTSPKDALPAMFQSASYSAISPHYGGVRFQATMPAQGWPDKFAVVTAWNPMDANPVPEKNVAATQELARRLSENGMVYFPVTGGSADGAHREPGFGIAFSNESAAVRWGNEFKQRAVFWIEGDELWLLSCVENLREYQGSWRSRCGVGEKDLPQNIIASAGSMIEG